jgi:hypothetical protein
MVDIKMWVREVARMRETRNSYISGGDERIILEWTSKK